jgi:hypothetical protein
MCLLGYTYCKNKLTLKVSHLILGLFIGNTAEILRSNPKLNQIGLSGLKNTQDNGQELNFFDWAMFSDCIGLNFLELSSCITPGPLGSEILRAINFNLLPCEKIETFSLTRIHLSSADVHRIYSGMSSLKRGYLDSIGDDGMLTAADLASQAAFRHITTDDDWLDSDIVFWMFHTTVIACSVLGLAVLASSIIQGKNENVESRNM